MNQTVLGFIIILLIFLVLLFLVYFFLGCEYQNKNEIINVLILVVMMFNILNLILSCFIVSKLSKIKKKYKTNYNTTNDYMSINEGIKHILTPIIKIICLLKQILY